jgi:hypothetical protein
MRPATLARWRYNLEVSFFNTFYLCFLPRWPLRGGCLEGLSYGCYGINVLTGMPHNVSGHRYNLALKRATWQTATFESNLTFCVRTNPTLLGLGYAPPL